MAKLNSKITPYWQIGILFPDGRKISKQKCSLTELFNTYFLKLDKYLTSEVTAEELLEKYKTAYASKEIKVVIRYIDSWGHVWKGKCAWPKKSKFIEYLTEKIYE